MGDTGVGTFILALLPITTTEPNPNGFSFFSYWQGVEGAEDEESGPSHEDDTRQ